MTRFDIHEDMKHSCFCQACLVGKEPEEMSRKDIRYCIPCQQFIEDDYANELGHRKYRPVPFKGQPITYPTAGRVSPVSEQGGSDKGIFVTHKENEMSRVTETPENPLIRDVDKKSRKKKGRPKKAVPEQLVLDLAVEGQSTRDIAEAVKEATKGEIEISPMTVSRILRTKKRSGD